MLRHWSFAAATALFALIGLVPPALADRYDMPIVSVVNVSRVSITLEVTAGATGLPAGFGVDWMSRGNFDADGGWDGGGLYYCTFRGVPTYNVWLGASSYQLGPYETARIEVGDLFDETGVETDYNVELYAATQYVFRAYAEGDANGERSYYTSTFQGTTMEQSGEESCIRTQGYWKNHPGLWPVQTLTLGTVTYTKAQLLQILGQPSVGNGLIILAHQLIATKLNIANGGDPGPIAGDVADADVLIGGLVVPPIGSGYLAPSTVQTTKDALDSYNNGQTDAGCGVTPTVLDSWGGVKTRYRN